MPYICALHLSKQEGRARTLVTFYRDCTQSIFSPRQSLQKMKFLLTRLTPFVGRHWLRIGLIGCALVLLSQKQVNLNVRLGHPGPEPLPATAPLSPVEEVEEGQPLLMSDGASVTSVGRSLLNRAQHFRK